MAPGPGERGRERGREAFDDDMLGHERRSSTSRPPGGRRSTPPTVFGWLREPDFLARVGEGVISREEQRLLLKSWGSDGGLSVEDVPLLDELRYALGDVPQRTDDERDLDETGLLEGGVDLQELTTVCRPRVRPRRAGLVRRRRTASRTTATPTSSSTRRRT